jgi:hypothetical protein
MTALRTRWLALRELGAPALYHYTRYRLRLSTGLIRRTTPARHWRDIPFDRWVRQDVPLDPDAYVAYRELTVGARFFFDASRPGLPWATHKPAADIVREANDILAGRFRLFGGPPQTLGFPPNWAAFPAPLGERPPLGFQGHWSGVDLGEEGADVRLVWELSRFGWVFPLARAYRRTGDAKYAEGCWRLIDDWCRANPPNRGVQWASAQEVALRILALAFAERGFFPQWSRDGARLQRLGQVIGFHAARIPPTLDYARAQGNNHLLSEAAGLYTAGLLFPELRDSERWRRSGRRLLEAGFDHQVFPDGGYVQHSVNYQRLALALGVWSARLGEVNGEPFPPRTLQAVARLGRSLAIQADSPSGRPPSFGPDDSSDILPLSSVEAGDARPLAAAASRLTGRQTWYAPGPWDETSRWLGLAEGERAELPGASSLPDAGLHYLRGGRARGCLRCVEFHERPGHSDQLHIDLWWGDRLLTLDPGSYLYNGPPPWQDGLAGALVHNAPVVDGEEPMQRAGRFLWAERAQGTFAGRWQGDRFEAMCGVHDGYRRLDLMLSRTVSLRENRAWVVADQAHGVGRHRLMVGWSLPDVPWEWHAGEIRLYPEGREERLGWDDGWTRAGLARAGEWIAGVPVEGPLERWGWVSPRYSALKPCLRLVLEVSGKCPLLLRTRISPDGGWPKSLLRAWDDLEAVLDSLSTRAPGDDRR